jgi:nitric oxide reductase large subunit
MCATFLSGLPSGEDRVSNVLKWVLLAVAVITFIVFFWAATVTYERAPPQPERFTDPGHIQTAIVWIGFAWIGAGLFLAPSMAGGREARGQALLVDLLFWATVVTVMTRTTAGSVQGCAISARYLRQPPNC